MIRAAGLGYSYKKRGKVLEDISFSLESGRVMAVLGNNGAGKTTLVKCLDRLLRPDTGKVEAGGRNLESLGRPETARIMAYVPQHAEGLGMTVFDAVLLGRKPYISLVPSDEDMEITTRVIDRMGLGGLSLRYTGELSGGELQKVSLARALAQQPEVLLLDEPTSSLDLYNQHEVMRLIRDIAAEGDIAVIVIMHDINLALRYCDDFLLIKEGRVYAYGDDSVITPESLMAVYKVEAEVAVIHGRKTVCIL